MKTKIFWFSGTGSSFWTAKKVNEGLKESELIPIANYDTNQMITADAVGIVFPVYAWGPPKIVSKFLKNIKIKPDTYIFIILTYNKDCGLTAKRVDKILHKKNLKLSASFGIKMPNNYPPLYKTSDINKIEENFKNAVDDVNQIIKSLKQNKTGNFEKAGLSKKILSKLIYPLFINLINKMSKSFYADSKCNQCGICEKICPNKNIVIENNKISWQNNCEQCFACFHWCPKNSIQFGKKTTGQIRYQFPEVKLNELIVKK